MQEDILKFLRKLLYIVTGITYTPERRKLIHKLTSEASRYCERQVTEDEIYSSEWSKPNKVIKVYNCKKENKMKRWIPARKAVLLLLLVLVVAAFMPTTVIATLVAIGICWLVVTSSDDKDGPKQA